MKKIMLSLVALLASTTVFSDSDLSGHLVKVKPYALLCNYFYIEKALTLMRSGDEESVNALISKNRCIYAEQAFYATITVDMSAYTRLRLIEVTNGGVSVWLTADHVECCFKRSPL